MSDTHPQPVEEPGRERPGSPARAGPASGRPFIVAAFSLALLSLAMFPIAGIAGVVCGSIGWSRGDKTLGAWSIVASVIGFFGGFFVAARVLRWL